MERNALRDFYYSSKGGEWTDSTNWTDPYIDYCFWKGIICTNDGAVRAVTSLNLTNDGLSGTLSRSIANLSSLEILELSDNDIKVSVTGSLIQSFFH